MDEVYRGEVGEIIIENFGMDIEWVLCLSLFVLGEEFKSFLVRVNFYLVVLWFFEGRNGGNLKVFGCEIFEGWGKDVMLELFYNFMYLKEIDEELL